MTDQASPRADPVISTYQNLVGVPSYHYDPIFAQAGARAFDAWQPDVVALELPPIAASELDWAADCWPAPVVSYSGDFFFPFVPGDSIFEAYRTARRLGIAVELVDLQTRPDSRPRPAAGSGVLFPGAEFAPRLGTLFANTVEAIDATVPPTGRDVAREAQMARSLASLMERCRRVLWVGGMAHWPTIVRRLTEGDFLPAIQHTKQPAGFRRMRLEATALHHMTSRTPWLVASYARSAASFEEAAATRQMALEALKPHDSSTFTLVALNPKGADDPEEWRSEAPGTLPDVARALNYARNLALTERLSERADLAELLMAASATVGSRYAGQLYRVAMADETTPATAELPELKWEHDLEHHRVGYTCEGEWITAEPWSHPELSLGVISLVEIERREQEIPHKDLPPAKPGEKKYWGGYPWDERAYEAFVSYVLRRASSSEVEEVPSTPFVSGLRDGLDARATVRHWQQGDVYVREYRRGRMTVTNGIIDWTSKEETSDTLTGRAVGGWIDPDFTRVGSVSRTVDDTVEFLQTEPFLLQRNFREFSFITLDAPTWQKDKAFKEGTLWKKVILPLVERKYPPEENLYGWLDLMLAFCAGKCLVYYSHYVPGPRVRDVARKYSVRLIHRPLRTIPEALLRRHQSFRFLNMSPSQWEELNRRVANSRGTWR